MNYYAKYLKYKNKYMQLKLQSQLGGDKAYIKDEDIKLINRFTNPIMEQYLNPIYGLFMCYSGFISNIWFLNNSGFDFDNLQDNLQFLGATSVDINNIYNKNNDIIHVIKKCIIGTNDYDVRPTKFLRNIDPSKFGKYIAIKYINKSSNILKYNINRKGTYTFDNINSKDKEKDKDNVKTLAEVIIAFGEFKFILEEKYNDEIYFHILLFCFWWVSNNISGIEAYYNGIKDIFTIVNNYIIKDEDKFYIKINSNDLSPNSEATNSSSSNSEATNPSFEEIIYKLTYEPFKIYAQGTPKNFCSPANQNKGTYPDCGEVVARNLINLLCINDNKFNIDYLEKFEAIPVLKDYYKIFNNFEIQSDEDDLASHYLKCQTYLFNTDLFEKLKGLNLNARDAWSYLIIFYDIVHNNNEFAEECKFESNIIKYNLNGGLSKDKNIPNFLQLIKNLLPKIENWGNLHDFNPKINIIENTINIKGVGKICISHSDYNNCEFIIDCQEGHYDIKIIKPPFVINNIDTFNEIKQKKINILKYNNISYNNILWIKINSDLIQGYFNSNESDDLLDNLLYKLLLTNQYSNDTRNRFEINITSGNVQCIIKNVYNLNNTKLKYYNNINNTTQIDKLIVNYKRMNQFTYISDNFNFVKLINLKTVNSILNQPHLLETIDLSPLLEIESIGRYFLYGCNNLKNIDLSSLLKVTSIGFNFMADCNKLQTITLPPNITSIGNKFMYKCFGLESIDLSFLSNLTSIEHIFLYYCNSLTTIILPPNITSIGNYFINECTSLESINLPPNITSIGNYFMDHCRSLESINLPSNITSIGNYFMNNCTLESIDLSSLSNLTSIKDHFMINCKWLKTIILPSNITSIGNNFIYDSNDKSSYYSHHFNRFSSLDDDSDEEIILTITCTQKQADIIKKNNYRPINFIIK